MYELSDLKNVYEIEIRRKNGTILIFKEVWIGVSNALKYEIGNVECYLTNLTYGVLKSVENCTTDKMLEEINREDNVDVIINPQREIFSQDYE